MVDEASQNVVPLTQAFCLIFCLTMLEKNLLEASAMTCPTTYLSLATFYTACSNMAYGSTYGSTPYVGRDDPEKKWWPQ